MFHHSKRSGRSIWPFFPAIILFIFVAAAIPVRGLAADAREIDVSVNVALEQFGKEVKGTGQFLASAKGYLVFPKVVKAGIGIGGEYGEGALRIGG